MNEELAFKAAFLEKQCQEFSATIDNVNAKLFELDEFNKNLDFFAKTNNKEMLSSLGNGVYLKTELASKELFVNAGAGVVIKKSPEETQGIVGSQIAELHETRTRLVGQLELYSHLLQQTVFELESSKDKK